MADFDNFSKDDDKKHYENVNEKSYCEVNIFGDVYKLVSNEYNFDRLRRTAEEVNKQMKIISEKYPDFPKYKIAILVALNVTDNLFKIRSEKNLPESDDEDISKEEIRLRIEKLINDIEQVL
ncbi:MAG: cell division protein ZapA [Spirochaetota bacterium]